MAFAAVIFACCLAARRFSWTVRLIAAAVAVAAAVDIGVARMPEPVNRQARAAAEAVGGWQQALSAGHVCTLRFYQDSDRHPGCPSSP